MLTEFPVYTSGKTRFRGYPALDKIPCSLKIVRTLESVIDSRKAEGFLVSEIENGSCLSVVSFCRDFFPYEDALFFHVLIERKKDLFLGASALLKSLFLMCKWNDTCTLISRHTSEHVETLLMLLGLGFRVSEFCLQSTRTVVIRMDFQKTMLRNFDYDTEIIVRDIYHKTANFPDKLIKESRGDMLTPSAIKLITRWMGLFEDSYIKKTEDLENIVERQENIQMKRVGNRDTFLFLIENIEINTGLIIFPEKAPARQIFLDLFAKLIDGQIVETLYTTKSDDLINSVLFLSGYATTSTSLTSKRGGLFKWEK